MTALPPGSIRTFSMTGWRRINPGDVFESPTGRQYLCTAAVAGATLRLAEALGSFG